MKSLSFHPKYPYRFHFNLNSWCQNVTTEKACVLNCYCIKPQRDNLFAPKNAKSINLDGTLIVSF